jgi:predicted RNA-binding Zn-ribbon protein involved in translation (DUF1610 family)
MKVIYNHDEGSQTRICSVCGYKHTKEYGYWGKTIEGDDEFIEMEGFELHSTDRSDGWHPSHNTHTIYACPKCGVLQIEV